MLRCMKEVSRQNGAKIFDANDDFDVDVDAEADALLRTGNDDNVGDEQLPDFLSIEDYLVRVLLIFYINGQLLLLSEGERSLHSVSTVQMTGLPV